MAPPPPTLAPAPRQPPPRRLRAAIAGSGVVDGRAIAVLALGVAQAAACIVVIVVTAKGLVYTAPRAPRRRCLLGGDVTRTLPCDFAFAYAAVGLAAALALVAAAAVDLVTGAAERVAENVAVTVSFSRAPCSLFPSTTTKKADSRRRPLSCAACCCIPYPTLPHHTVHTCYILPRAITNRSAAAPPRPALARTACSASCAAAG